VKSIAYPAAMVMVVVLALVVASPATAQNVTKVGTTAAKFLSIPAGARALGMGGAFVAVANDATAMYWNVAGLARLNQSEAIFSHANWIADIKYNYGAVALPMGDLGTAGISFTSMTMDEMERTTEQEPDGTGQTFTAGSFAVGLAYAKNLTDWFSIGGNVKYVSEQIWNSSATGLAFDIGTLFNTPFAGVKFGASITNFGQKMRMSGDDLVTTKDITPNNGNNPNVPANLTTDSFDLPLALRIGLSYEPIADEDNDLIIAIDGMHPNDNAESLSFGAEFSGFKRIVSIRAGYKGFQGTGSNDSEEQFTLGGGLRYTIGANFTVKFDYAYEKFGRLNNVHKFAVGVLF
jgi:hypothetical protein